MKYFLYIVLFLFLLNFSACARRVVYKPANVTFIKKAPLNHKVIRVNGQRYYFWNGKHYRKTRKGYVLLSL